VRVLGTIVLVGMLTAAGGGGVYVVRAGDTLSAIAQRVGSSTAALAGANALKNENRILVGQRLTIPDAATAPPGTYVVRPGDTISGIAKRHGISMDALIAANGLVGPTLYVGVRLRLTPLTGETGRVLTGPDVRGGAASYVVRAGDTLAEIAARHGTSISSIVRANGLRDADVISIGQRLALPGAWVCPVQGRIRYVNDWGMPRAGGRAHEGTDIFADRGTPVVAPVAGTVTQKVGAIGGRQVTLQGDDGFVYLSTHLNSFGAAGRVAAGNVIGTVGTSGNAAGTAPHTHFEIHPAGKGPVNPYPTIREACGA
jgi:murein DD-endopeptidase MepM/ murein hydrolase activator NlpD